MKKLAFALLVVGLGACDLSPYDLSAQQGGGSGDGDGGVVLDDGRIVSPSDASPPDAATCVPRGPDDTCDELDNDCDGTRDNTFNKQEDPNNCGTCGHRCGGDGAVVDCNLGACAFVECQPGFADHDADPLTCEYRCPLFPAIAEDCNGVDDDCDGTVDEDLPAPPTGQCRTTPGTPCAGTSMTCATRGGATRWFCDYDADVEFDPSIPNGIVLAEQLCDGKDGDCDGDLDDSFSDLDQECDDGNRGVCRDVGKRICDPADPSQTKCDLSVLPDAQPQTAETCDGQDNNCDGQVDNPPTAGAVIDSMTLIPAGTGVAAAYLIDTFEVAHPDATGAAIGVSTARSCSNPGVLPWTGATFSAASAACTAAGKVLCTGPQWQLACKSEDARTFPYGNTFGATTCNTESNAGAGLVPTGSLTTCTSKGGVFDLSGNLKEWTNEVITGSGGAPDLAILRGGAYDTPAIGATCAFKSSRATVGTVLPTIGFRCCKAP